MLHLALTLLLLGTLLVPAGCARRPPTPNWTVLESHPFRAGLWRVDAARVPALLAGAKSYLTRLHNDARAAEALDRWEESVCQVTGYTEADGHRAIEFYFFPRRTAEEVAARDHERRATGKSGGGFDWRRDYFTVMDGGASFWSLRYDVGRERFSEFSPHGEA